MQIINIKRAPGLGHDEAIEVETYNDALLYLDEQLPERQNPEYSFKFTSSINTLVGYCADRLVIEAEIIPSWRVSKATGTRYATS